jgi:MFS family permease
MTTPTVDSRYAWQRLVCTLALMTLGSSAMYVVAVVLPAVQAEFGSSRSQASLPYTLMMVGFGVGGIFMGRLADRQGVMWALFVGAVGLSLGFAAAAASTSIVWFALAHGVLLGLLGSSATFAPLVADTSLWFVRRRGIAVAICASGNYLAGALWPPLVQQVVNSHGWRTAYLALAVLCATVFPLLAWFMRQRPPAQKVVHEAVHEVVHGVKTVAAPQVAAGASTVAEGGAAARVNAAAAGAAARARPTVLPSEQPFGLSMNTAQALLCLAGVACCVAMSMPQVHIVAYCSDLGFGAARGAEMLSLMLACGIVSRIVSGLICDRIGGIRTLLLGSVLQGLALLLFIPFDGLLSLYLVSALFGLFQGGIVPSYAIIVREHFPPAQAGARVGTVLMATLLGMALGGWMSGKVFDLTGSYHAAFINGVLWNLVNLAVVLFLMQRVWKAQRQARSRCADAP